MQDIDLPPRLPDIAWQNGFARHWCHDSPAVTHIFNALSMLFPQAERYFIEVAREVLAGQSTLPAAQRRAIEGFVAQESLHAGQHNRYNAVLAEQGYDNVAAASIARLQARSRKLASPLTRLAVVCGLEHYTAILGEYVLSHPHLLEHASPDMALVWGWHAVEETEHKAVCFDLYTAAGGRWPRRAMTFGLVTLNFTRLFLRCYLHLLRRDACLTPRALPRTIADYTRFTFGRNGVAWALLAHGVQYLQPGFHPWQRDNLAQARAWLQQHGERLRPLGTRTA